jgi:hypothetical protein
MKFPVKPANTPPSVIQIGGPFRESHPFYEAALSFREALMKLGIEQTSVVQEFAREVTPLLEAANQLKGVEGIEVSVAVTCRLKGGKTHVLKIGRTP